MTSSYQFSVLPSVEENQSPPGCRRRHGRRLQEALESDAGAVLDLSAGGMRVIARKKPSDKTNQITIISSEGQLTVAAKAAWCKRMGFGRFEIGFEFLEIDADARRMLAAISSAHRHFGSKVA